MAQNNLLYNHILGSASTLGCVKVNGGIEFTTVILTSKSKKLLVYDNEHRLIDHVNMRDYMINDVLSSVIISNLSIDFTYVYEEDGVIMPDLYEKSSTGIRQYFDTSTGLDESRLYTNDFDWEDDVQVNIPFKDIIAYQLHVRGFTMHSSSKVKNRGTYLGIVEKIPHFTDLGINQVILMPSYEFVEYDLPRNNEIKGYKEIISPNNDSIGPKVNFWGFKEGYYFMPKAAYAKKDAVSEFKQMVKALHSAGIEVIMRFYFPDEVNKSLIASILDFWHRSYHVDGFAIMGNDLPFDIISADYNLRSVKLYCDYYDKSRIVYKSYGYNRNIAYMNNEFANCIRRFLKSDENMVSLFLEMQRRNPSDIHVLNNITDYSGFTLNDLVSYDYKHNEANGEDNHDGESFNHSWNCGVEGVTRKKSTMQLRRKQIMNALIFLLMAQATPVLLAGDEFLNTQGGNNNPYCQDNEVGWVIWKNNGLANEIYDFTKQLIKLRKAHPILHQESEFRIMDYASCGFPDISYHGEEAWAAMMDSHIRHIGIMLCGKYAFVDKKTEDDFFYFAYNMHWEEHSFALPKLPKGLKWSKVMGTQMNDKINDKINDYADISIDDEAINISGRTVMILKSIKCSND